MTAWLGTINAGSSSLKSAVYERGSLALAAGARISRIGLEDCRLGVWDGSGAALMDEQVEASDHASALELWFDWLRRSGFDGTIAAVGHRLVHGGRRYVQPQPITRDMMSVLEELLVLDPDHM